MPLDLYTGEDSLTLSAILLVEIDRRWCRQEITLAPTDDDLSMGTVLAKTGDGDYAPYMATEETAEASAVMVSDAKKSEERQPAAAVMRGAVVRSENLIFLESVTEEQKAAALEQLTALGIVPQE